MRTNNGGLFIMGNGIDFLDRASLRIISALMQKPIYLRQVSEKLGIPVSTAFNAIKKLEKQGILKSKKEKNRKFFELNKENCFAKQAIALIFSNQIIQSNAFKTIKAMKPDAVYLFGSAAKGRINALSDLNIATISERQLPKEKLFAAKTRLEKETGKEVQILNLTEEKMQELRKENQELFNEIAFGGILLWGEEL